MVRKKKIIIALSVVLMVCLLTITAGAYKLYSKVNKVKKVDIQYSDSDIGITKENEENLKEMKKNNIQNFLLLGVDKEENATDVIMVISLNKDNGKIKIISVLRDIYIEMGADKVNKLNYAYHYGGAVNTLKVMNETFGLNIRDYGLVTFNSLIKIVDALGGVEVELTYDEATMVKSMAQGIAIKEKVSLTKNVVKEGKNNLNGVQALAYSRLRKLDSDFNRTDRQRHVINGVIKKAQGLNLLQLDKFTDVVLQNIETNMGTGDILKLIPNIMSGYKKGIEETKIPIEGTWKGHYWDNGSFYFTWNKEKNIDFLLNYINK